MALVIEYMITIPTTDGLFMQTSADTLKDAKKVVKDYVDRYPGYYVLPATIEQWEACAESRIKFFHPNGKTWKYSPRALSLS